MVFNNLRRITNMITAKVALGIKASVSAKYSEATAKRFIEDAIFLYEKAITTTDELERKRFSRIATTLVPYYLESLSNYLYDEFIKVKFGDADNRSYLLKFPLIFIAFIIKRIKKLLNYQDFKDKDIDKVDKRTDLPIPIRRLRAVYSECLKTELRDNNINGIRDIFTIRNRITAHPAGRSTMETTIDGWKRKDKNISYIKLKTLPEVYSHFYPEHVCLIFIEVHDFLIKYITSIKNNLTDKQYNYIWPKELIDWKSTHASPPSR